MLAVNVKYAYYYITASIFLENVIASQDTIENSFQNDDPVREFDVETFETDISEHSPHFIMFYAPWCGHCKKFHPTWNQLGEKYSGTSRPLTIGKVDCSNQTPICINQEINGYPTLKLFTKGPENGVKYRGQRDLSSLERFIAEQLGTEYEGDSDVPLAVAGLVEFTDVTFTNAIKKGSYFIKFYAPWCTHCQRLAPTWELLAKSLEHDHSVVIGKIDCTEFKSICSEYEVKGYPTLFWIEDGKKLAKYAGDRSHEDLKRFVSEQLGERGLQEESKESPSVVTLTAENFENAIAEGVTFVKYFAPWCGHCKRLAPTFEELGKKFVAFSDVNIAKVDCSQEINKNLCTQEEVDGFPTLHLYKSGKKLITYNGDRSLDDMAEFVMSRLDHDEL